jgi:hypothetical protein
MSRKKACRPARGIKASKNTISRRSNLKLTMQPPNGVDGPALSPRDIANKLDEDWFRSHPSRSHRIRHVIPGEVPEGTTETYAAVRQMKPGSASPRYFDLDVALPRDEIPEEIACDMYDRVGEQERGTIAGMRVRWH